MKIAIDTNVILDTLARRDPFFEHSQAVMRLVAEGKVDGAMTACAVTDIYRILRGYLDGSALAAALRGLVELLEVMDVTRVECRDALGVFMDYEDALLVCCAQNWNADCIVTRNAKGFTHSPVRTISPKDFLKAGIY